MHLFLVPPKVDLCYHTPSSHTTIWLLGALTSIDLSRSTCPLALSKHTGITTSVHECW